MTVKELIEELQEIDKKYHDSEVVIYNTGSADEHYIQSVDDEPNWPNEDEDDDYDQDIYINI